MGKPYFLPLLIFLVCGHASARVFVGGTFQYYCGYRSWNLSWKPASVAALDDKKNSDVSLSYYEGGKTLLTLIKSTKCSLYSVNLDDLESRRTFIHQQPLEIQPFRNSKDGEGIHLVNIVPCNTFAEKRTEILPEVYHKLGGEGLALVSAATSPGRPIERNSLKPLPLMGMNGLLFSAEIKHEFNKSLR